jgi:hypothetical protein
MIITPFVLTLSRVVRSYDWNDGIMGYWMFGYFFEIEDHLIF